jgi:hypothetical protein
MRYGLMVAQIPKHCNALSCKAPMITGDWNVTRWRLGVRVKIPMISGELSVSNIEFLL